MYKKAKLKIRQKNRKAIQVRNFKNIEKDIKRKSKEKKICKYVKKLHDKKENK